MDKWSGTQFQNLPKRPKAVLDYRNGGVSSEDDEGSGSTSTSTSASTMDRIVEKLKRFGYVDDMIERNERVPERGSVEDIFYVEEGMLPSSRGGFPAESPLGVENSDNGGDGRSLFPWEKRPLNGDAVRNSVRMRRSKTSVAELTLPESELRRLRHLAVAMKSRMKIGGAGVTKAIVDAIHEKWKLSEVVRLKCEGPPTLNMKRLHEILEVKLFLKFVFFLFLLFSCHFILLVFVFHYMLTTNISTYQHPKCWVICTLQCHCFYKLLSHYYE